MQHAPTEIWYQISSHACTDSGSTGRSLSLVSKFIREASAPFKLQSVAVHGPKQFISFNKLLLATPPYLRRTRYLFISAIPPSLPPRRGLLRLFPARKPSEAYPRWAEKDAGEFMSAFSSIIEQVAGSVEILYFEIPMFHFRPLDPTLSFPRLEEVTSNCFFGSQAPYEVAGQPQVTICPKLRRWHFIHYPLSAWAWISNDVIGTIRLIAPCITHVRFSDLYHPFGVSQQLSGLVSSLNSALGLDPDRDPLAQQPSETFEVVYAQPGVPPDIKAGLGAVRLMYDWLLMSLQNLNEADDRFVLLMPRADDVVSLCAASVWEERINGGEGCWSLSESVRGGKKMSGTK
ncbi:hypothetical protein HWV62_40128 [Athelia sp. TMB]|nr:hypothetical protein HWV62_40128 [Athelia sp. TMB]